MIIWKCPHCGKLEFSDDNIEMFLCPNCPDCHMEILETNHKLSSVKPKDFKGFDKSGKQLCMRCSKSYAVEDDIFCNKCIKERAEIDDNIKSVSKIMEKKKDKEDVNSNYSY